MLRNIAAVVLGYIVMGLTVFIAMYAGYEVMGGEWAFKPGTYEVTGGWIALMLISGLAAAVLGGLICGALSKHSRKAVIALMVLVAGLGVLSVAAQMAAPELPPEELVRTDAPPVLEAASVAQQPTWVMFANIVIGVGGVMLGASLVCPRNRPESTADDGGA